VHGRERRRRQGPPSLVAHVHQLLLQAHVLSCQPPYQLVQLTVLLLQLLTPLLYLVHLHSLALPALVCAFPVALHACLQTTPLTVSAIFLSGVGVPSMRHRSDYSGQQKRVSGSSCMIVELSMATSLCLN